MKPLHLFLSACLLTLSLSSVHAGLFDNFRPHQGSIFHPVREVDTVFRAQSEGVPLPPGTTSSPPFSSVPAGTQPVPYGNQPGTTFGPSLVVPAGGYVDPAANGSFFQGGPQFGSGTIQGQTGLPLTQDPSTWNAFSPPMSPDPFATAPGFQQPYAPYSPYGGYGTATGGGAYTTYGANGPAPYRQGWQNSFNMHWIPKRGSSASPATNYEQYGLDYNLTYSGPLSPGWMFTWTNQFRLRNWDAPVGGPGLPGAAYRFGWDFELESAQAGPISLKLGLTPSFNTDFDRKIGSSAVQLDGRGMLIFQLDQYWSLVLGAAYWDRVNDKVIPYGGLVYRDDYWEWRLMYPESTISLFLGNEALWSKWAYVRGEYHVEAYDIRTGGGGNDQVELEDYRLMFGFRMDGGLYSWFTEAGWIFDRDVDYQSSTNGSYSPNSSFLARLGWNY